MNTTAAAIARYTIITDGGSAASYRDREFAQIVAVGDDCVLSDVTVVVSWGGHEGRATIDGIYTLDELAENADGLLEAIEDADLSALASLIREATSEHTVSIDHNMEIVDFESVRADVAAALGEEPHGQTPTTLREAIEWIGRLVPEEFVKIVPA